MITIKVKKLVEEAHIPCYANPGDAGLDVWAVSKHWDDERQCWIYGIGLAFQIPEGYVGLLFPRSSVRDHHFIMANCVGVIDSGYRGEVSCTFKPMSHSHQYDYKVGDKIAQLIVVETPYVSLVECDKLDDSVRGENGHGSTGN